MRRPVINATRLLDGSWNTARLWPLPRFGPHPPQTKIESGTVQIHDFCTERPSRWVFRDVDFNVAPSVSVSGTQQAGELGAIAIEGSVTSDFAAKIECRGEFDCATSRWNVRGSASQVRLGTELFLKVPPPLAAKLAVLRSLQGTVDTVYEVGGGPAAELPFRFRVAGRFAGQVDDLRLPRPLRCSRP